VFLRAKSERVHVNTFIRATGVRLVRLDPREVRTFTLREAVLAVKLELSSDDGVLAPTMEVQRGLAQNECTSIRDSGVLNVAVSSQITKAIKDGRVQITCCRRDRNSGTTKIYLIVRVLGTMPISSEGIRNIIIQSTGIVEKTTSINVCTRISGNGSGTTESMDSVGKSINGISVVEGLGTKNLEQKSITHQR
jgi:hypothetical protein